MFIKLNKTHNNLIKKSIQFYSKEYEKRKNKKNITLKEKLPLYSSELMIILKLSQLLDNIDIYGEVDFSKEEFHKIILRECNYNTKVIIGKTKITLWD